MSNSSNRFFNLAHFLITWMLTKSTTAKVIECHHLFAWLTHSIFGCDSTIKADNMGQLNQVFHTSVNINVVNSFPKLKLNEKKNWTLRFSHIEVHKWKLYRAFKSFDSCFCVFAINSNSHTCEMVKRSVYNWFDRTDEKMWSVNRWQKTHAKFHVDELCANSSWLGK